MQSMTTNFKIITLKHKWIIFLLFWEIGVTICDFFSTKGCTENVTWFPEYWVELLFCSDFNITPRWQNALFTVNGTVSSYKQLLKQREVHLNSRIYFKVDFTPPLKILSPFMNAYLLKLVASIHTAIR